MSDETLKKEALTSKTTKSNRNGTGNISSGDVSRLLSTSTAGVDTIERKYLKQMTEDEKMTKQLNEVWIMCESQRQMHRLAHAHYDYLDKVYHIMPLTIITMMSGILAFLATANVIHDDAKEYLSISVGILSIISGAIQSTNQKIKYDSKAEMHKNASLGMKKITDQIDFLQTSARTSKSSMLALTKPEPDISLQIKDQEDDKYNEKDEENNEKREKNNNDDATATVLSDNSHANKYETYTEVYQQCIDSCQSQIPIRISQAFKMADSRLQMSLRKEDKANIKKAYGYLGKQIIHRCLYNEVFCTITDYYHFPMFIPQPEDVVQTSMKNVGLSFHEKLIDFRRDEEGTSENARD